MEVLFEDNHIIAINKNTSDIVQGDKTGDKPLSDKVKEYLKIKYNKPGDVYLGVVHRIDRPVSGIVLFARTSKASARLSKMFQLGEIEKKYWAVVKTCPNPSSGSLIHHMYRNNAKNKSFAYDIEKPDTKKAVLHYSLLSSSDNYHLLEIDLETGRHHQIRCQLSKIGSPIKGDIKYGFSRTNNYPGINLHARSVRFIHPIRKEEIYIEANLPENDTIWQFFSNQVVK